MPWNYPLLAFFTPNNTTPRNGKDFGAYPTETPVGFTT
jgi:hypothetical protein